VSEALVVAIVTSVPPTLAAVVTLVVGLRSSRKIARRVEEVHRATNSLTDRLVASTRLEAHAAGIKEERERQMLD